MNKAKKVINILDGRSSKEKTDESFGRIVPGMATYDKNTGEFHVESDDGTVSLTISIKPAHLAKLSRDVGADIIEVGLIQE